MITISKLSDNDLKHAYAIEMVSHTYPLSERLFYSNQGKNYSNYKISHHNNMVGFCIINKIQDEATLFNLAIHPTYQRQGFAKALLNHVIDQLKKQCVETLWLEVRKSNLPAIGLYHSLGFNVITIRPDYYPTANKQREDAIIMVNSLIINDTKNT